MDESEITSNHKTLAKRHFDDLLGDSPGAPESNLDVQLSSIKMIRAQVKKEKKMCLKRIINVST